MYDRPVLTGRLVQDAARERILSGGGAVRLVCAWKPSG